MQQEALILAQQARLEHYCQYDDYLPWFEKQRLRCWFEDDVFHIVNGALQDHVKIMRNAIEIQRRHREYSFASNNLIVQRERSALFAEVDGSRVEIFAIDKDTHTHTNDLEYVSYPYEGITSRPIAIVSRYLPQKNVACFPGHSAEFARELDNAVEAWGIPCLHISNDMRTCVERGETCCIKPV